MSRGGAAGRHAAVLGFVALLASAVAAEDLGWIDVRYGDLVDARELSHSGEPVGALLTRLGGRPLASAGGSVDDRTAHTLLEPLLEPYAFVLSDALDSLEPARAMVEVGRLWAAGEAQPAWAELLRARRLVVESDGSGRLRLFLPITGDLDPAEGSAAAARRAYDTAWPVLRHVFRAELTRLHVASPAAVLSVEARAFRHSPERATFRLGRAPWVVEVRETGPDGRRAPLDLVALAEFLESGLELEGGRLSGDGTLRLLGSRPATRPTILGRPVGLADLAVAYRAVFHGGLAEPYMSLDRGRSPQTSIVNYGGRLRDTALGMVSLLCDMRFKTFSLGLDLSTGEDMRARVRATVPGFRSHLERIAEDPGSAGFVGQQTRLWFYPDTVDLTVSPQSDLLAMRRVRMAAASERVEGEMTTPVGGERPWTRATVEEINQDYDGLARHFPELADLDQVVRMLSLFTWLREAGRVGVALPDLDALLAVEVPALPTPRTFPQMLAFNALPAPAQPGEVVAYDRLAVGDALERLNPSTGPALPARTRFERAKQSLDASDPQMGALLADLAKTDPSSADELTLDVLAYRAERLRMHAMVLSTLGAERTEPLVARERNGERLRVFSVGIGGLDLGMGPALARARSRSIGLGGDAGARTDSAATAPVRATTAPHSTAAPTESPGLASRALPGHGPTSTDGESRIESKPARGGPGFVVRTGESGVDATSRRVVVDASGRAVGIERVEAGRRLRYRIEAEAGGLRARSERPAERVPAAAEAVDPPSGLAVLQLVSERSAGGAETVDVHESSNDGAGPSSVARSIPRAALVRLLLGREVDPSPGQPMPLAAPAGEASAIEARMLLAHPGQRILPWDGPSPPLVAEVDPLRVARALAAWDPSGPSIVVGTDPAKSPARWASAGSLDGGAILVLPRDAFPGLAAPLRERLARAWSPGTVLDEVPETVTVPLVVLVSHEAPDVFAMRFRAVARAPALRGRLLAGWSLGGALRDDLPAWVLAEAGLAALGLGEPTALPQRDVETRLGTFGRALRSAAGRRVEQVPGPFLWFY